MQQPGHQIQGQKKLRYSVLAFIINKYEVVHEIGEKDPEAEYLLITDDKYLTSETWTVVYDPELEPLSTYDRCYAIRFNTFKYCHSDICVRLDASIEIFKSLKPLIDIFEEGHYDIALMPHPLRNNFIEEYDAWVAQRGYDSRQAERIIENMRQKGYDFSYKGMFQTNFWIQRRDGVTLELNSRTFEFLKELGQDGRIERINQVPFSFIMNTYYSHLKVLPLSEQIVRSAYMQWYFHNSFIPNMYIAYDISQKDVKYMFNREVECLYLFPDDMGSLIDRIRFLEQQYMAEHKRFDEVSLTAVDLNRHLTEVTQGIIPELTGSNAVLQKELERCRIYLNNGFIKFFCKLIRAYRKHIAKKEAY